VDCIVHSVPEEEHPAVEEVGGQVGREWAGYRPGGGEPGLPIHETYLKQINFKPVLRSRSRIILNTGA
jgi:hypothetical protein